MEKPKQRTEKVEVQRFLMDNVLTTAELSKMSKKALQKHIEYLEQTALSLDGALVIAIEQLNVRVRARSGELL